MGYQDTQGLRPGRSAGRMNADTGNPDDLASSRSSSGGYRASGTVSPIRAPEPKPVEPAPQGETALNSVYAQPPAYQLPKAPGMFEQVGMGVLGNVANQAVGKGIDYLTNQFSSPASAAVGGLGGYGTSAGAAEAMGNLMEPSYSLTTASDWGGSSLSGLGGTSAWDMGPVSDTALLDTGASGAAAESGMGSLGSVAPYIPAVGKLVQGDVGGAVTSAAGAAIGNMILPGIGGVIGGIVGGSVICTETYSRGDASRRQIIASYRYLSKLTRYELAGYYAFAVPFISAIHAGYIPYSVVRPFMIWFTTNCACRGGYGKVSKLSFCVGNLFLYAFRLIGTMKVGIHKFIKGVE